MVQSTLRGLFARASLEDLDASPSLAPAPPTVVLDEDSDTVTDQSIDAEMPPLSTDYRACEGGLSRIETGIISFQSEECDFPASETDQFYQRVTKIHVAVPPCLSTFATLCYVANTYEMLVRTGLGSDLPFWAAKEAFGAVL